MLYDRLRSTCVVWIDGGMQNDAAGSQVKELWPCVWRHLRKDNFNESDRVVRSQLIYVRSYVTGPEGGTTIFLFSQCLTMSHRHCLIIIIKVFKLASNLMSNDQLWWRSVVSIDRRSINGCICRAMRLLSMCWVDE